MIIGNLSLALALPLSIYCIFTSCFSVNNPALMEKARKVTHLVTLLVTISSILLIFAFINNSFEIEYVASYSSRGLPFIYKLSGIWAGLDGSLLFWLWLLTIFATIAAFRKKDDFFPYTNAVIQCVAAFFLIMLVYEASPFTQISPVPEDGRGLNPLLQNIFMLFHPPLLYIGYVGFTVPFAYAIAALLIGREPPKNWEKDVRLWTIISWLFLTAGNLLGAMWAYVELGWGGFWAWDPVENAGILPWFTATALLHSIILQEKRGMLRIWNLTLIILTFLLTIFGTFITRSGIIESVHSFSDVTIGTYFIIFLSAAAIFSFYLIISRRRTLRGRHEIESFFSRESAFYMNSFLFILILIAVLWGTVFPFFAELFTGQKMTVGPPYFNRVAAPLGIALLFLTGIGPELSWRRLRRGLLRREFLIPIILAAIGLVTGLALGVKKWFPLATIAGSLFVLTTIFDEFFRSALITAKRDRCNYIKALFSLFRQAPRRYGGYLVHLGVVFLFIGIAGSAYQSEYDFSLEKGEKTTVAGYELKFDSADWVSGRESNGVIANVSILKDNRLLKVLKPALFLHKNQPKPIAEVDLNIRPLRDIYLALGGISRDEGGAEFKLIINPLISFVWLGGIVMIIGTIVAIFPARRKRGEAGSEIELDVALGRAAKEDFI